MDFKALANEFLHATFELNKQAPRKEVNSSMSGERFVLHYLYTMSAQGLPSDISEKMEVSSARVAVILNRLEDKGYILRSIDPQDRRRIVVELTPKGKEIAKEEHDKVIGMVEKMLKLLGDQDAKDLIRIIQKLSSLSDEIEIPSFK